MLTLEQRRKLVTDPAAILAFAFIISALLELLTASQFSWTSVIMRGTVTGIFFIVIIHRQKKRISKVTNVSSQEQQWTLEDSIRLRKIPTDAKLRQAFPTYLDTREEALTKISKQTPVTIAFIVFISLVAATVNPLLVIIGVGLLALFLAQRKGALKQLQDIAYLRKKLEAKDAN
jgi:hypothetical protein